ncbi:MAG: DUF6788 family protein [Gemmatimonadales bacterium]
MKDPMNADRQLHRLLERRARAVAQAPDLAELLRGTVGRRYVRCGKAGCWCQRGRGHGPVLYLSVSLGVGRTRQITIAREAYRIAQQYVRNYWQLWRSLEAISTVNRTLLQHRLLPAPAATREPRRRRQRRRRPR